MRAAMGRTSFSAKSRATAWIIFCSSLRSMFILFVLPEGAGTRASPRPPPAASSPDPFPPGYVSRGHRHAPRGRVPRARPSPSPLQELLELGAQERHHLEEVPHDPVVGDLENRGLGVLVDGADHLGGPHPGQVLDGPRDPEAQVELGRDGPSGLSDLVAMR